MILMSSLWALLLNDLPLFQRMSKASSKYKLVDLFIRACTCPMCLSAHLFWIWIFIIYGSGIGLFFCPIPYFLTYTIERWIINIKI
jgi:hypothetical protein